MGYETIYSIMLLFTVCFMYEVARVWLGTKKINLKDENETSSNKTLLNIKISKWFENTDKLLDISF